MPSPMIVGESQSYWLPPHEVMRTRQITAVLSIAKPSQSTRLALVRRGRCSFAATTNSARMPIGMFT